MFELVRFNCKLYQDMPGLIPEKIADSRDIKDLIKTLVYEEGDCIYLVKHGGVYKAIKNKDEMVEWITVTYGSPSGFTKDPNKINTKAAPEIRPATKVRITEEKVVDLDDYSNLEEIKTDPMPVTYDESFIPF